MDNEFEVPYDVCLIDADSMIYNICWFEKSPANAQRALMEQVSDVAEKSGAPDVYVFVKGKNNFRFEADPEYKGNRVADPTDLLQQRVAKLYEFARENFVQADGGEADDYCGIYARETLEDGRCPIVAHVDKDLNTIPGWHMSLNKKDKGRVYFVEPHEAYLFQTQQLVAGDTTDNIKGIPGMGLIKAIKAFDGFKYSDMLDMTFNLYRDKVGKQWKKLFVKTANCTMLRDAHNDMRVLTFDELVERLKWKGDPTLEYHSRLQGKNIRLAAMPKDTIGQFSEPAFDQPEEDNEPEED